MPAATNGAEHITARDKGATSKKKVMSAHETKEPRQKDFCFAVVCYRLLRSLVFMESENRWGNRKTIKILKEEYAGWTIIFLNRKFCRLESHPASVEQ